MRFETKALWFGAAIVVVFRILTAGTASAQFFDQLAQCDLPNSSCNGSQYEVHAGEVAKGDPFEMYIDYDITHPGVEACYLTFFATFDSNKLAFVNARRLYVQPPGYGDWVYCTTQPDPPTEWCPTCDTVLVCDWFNQDYYVNLQPSVSAEIQLIFQTIVEGEAGVYADLWGAYGRDESYACTVDLTLGGPEISLPDVLVTVPEPGGLAMLAAGVPLLAYLGRRRGRA